MDAQLELLQWIQQLQTPFLNTVFTLITMTAEEVFFIVVAAWFLWCGNKELGYRVGFAFLSSTVVNPLLKEGFRIERPVGREGIEAQRLHTATGYAFPSGHTQGASSFWTGIMTTARRRWVTALGILMILLVGASRMYLGVHWPTDVLGGMVIGVGWVFLVNLLYDKARALGRPELLLVLIVPLAGGYLFAPNEAYVVSFGSLAGFWLGFVLEVRYIHHDLRGPWWVKALKILLGLAVVLLIKEGLKPLLAFDYRAADLIRYFCIGLWITAGAPLLFSRLFPVKGALRSNEEGRG
jgi:membrane-associated phospholipid phosphatase